MTDDRRYTTQFYQDVLAAVCYEPNFLEALDGKLDGALFEDRAAGWLVDVAYRHWRKTGGGLNRKIVRHYLREDGAKRDIVDAVMLALPDKRLSPNTLAHMIAETPRFCLRQEVIRTAMQMVDMAESEQPERAVLAARDLDRWEAARSERRFTIVGADELVRQKLVRETLIGSGVLFRQDSSLLFAAPPKHHKSWWVLNLAAHLAAGVDFLGWEIPSPRRVLYFALENGQYVTQKRLRRLLENDVLADAGKNITVAYTSTPLWIDHDVETYERAIEQARPDVVILDTLRAAHRSNENASDEMVEVMANIRAVITRFEAAPVVIHHTSKGEFKPEDAFKAIRGSTSITGWYTTNMVMKAMDEQRTHFEIFIEGRDIDGPGRLTVAYDVRPGGVGTRLFDLAEPPSDAEADAPMSRAEAKRMAQDELLEYIISHKVVQVDTAKGVLADQGLSQPEIKQVIAALEDGGALVREGAGTAKRTLRLAAD